MQLNVIPGQDTDPEKVDFSWEVLRMSKRSMDLQLAFENPLYISTKQDKEKLEIVFNDRIAFLSEAGLPLDLHPDDGKHEGAQLKFEHGIPKQLPPDAGQKMAMEAFESAGQTSKGIFGANFALNLTLSASLNQLWALVNAQQLFIMLPLCQVVLPINASKFFGAIAQIATFEIYDLNDHINDILDVPDTEPVSDNFEELGFESKYMLNNMGTMLIFYLIYPVFMLAHWMTKRKLCRTQLCCKKFEESLKHFIYFKLIITVIFESFAIVAISCLIGLQVIDFGSAGLSVQSLTCIFFLVLITVMPVLMLSHVNHHFARLNDQLIKKRVGSVYEELDIRKGKKILIQPMFFLLRRLVLGYAVVYMNDNFAGQIMVIALQTLASAMVLSYVHAFKSMQRHRMEFFNEVVFLLILYTILCFSDWLGDEELQLKIGFVSCSLICIHLGLNFLLIIVTAVRMTKRRCQIRILRKKQQKDREDLKEKL